MQRLRTRCWQAVGLFSALSATCTLSFAAGAQSTTTTWGGPVNSDYNIPSNWTRGVPTTDTTAVFGTEPARTTITDIGRGPANIVATWQILAGSPAYTFTMAPLGTYTFQLRRHRQRVLDRADLQRDQRHRDGGRTFVAGQCKRQSGARQHAIHRHRHGRNGHGR